MEAMGFSWDQVHDEAERLEHAISEEFEDRMAALLGDPKHDPHGDPIPSKEGIVADVSRRRLSDVKVGDVVLIERVVDDNGEQLRQLGWLGLKPRVIIKVMANDHSNANLWCNICPPSDHLPFYEATNNPIKINRSLAQSIFVK